MDRKVAINRLKNVNFSSKETVKKTTAAVTLLLSTAACVMTSEEQYCCFPLFICGVLGFVWLLQQTNRSVGGSSGGSSGGPHY
jgi:cobalamin synthase